MRSEAAGGDKNAEPPAPRFRNLEMVKKEIEAVVRNVRPSVSLDRPHPVVARLLAQDEEREKNQVSSYDGPKFRTVNQQRRLRIMSALFIEFQRLGCAIDGRTHAGEDFSLRVGSNWLQIRIDVEHPPYDSIVYEYARRAPPKEGGVRFALLGTDRYQKPLRTWKDGARKLEAQMTDVVFGVLFHVEEQSRLSATDAHRRAIEWQAYEARQVKLAAEKAEAERIAREKAAVAARLESLLEGADALERADRIRRYVEAVRNRCSQMDDPPPWEAVRFWAEYALQQADDIDPVISNRFLSGASE